jgi:carboxymethylenebutenolidase
MRACDNFAHVERVTFARVGGEASGEIALPVGEGSRGAVIVIHEWWGLNAHIRDVCERLAAEGFIALAVDIYGGKVTADPAVAMQLANEMKTTEALDDIRGALAFLRSHPKCNGRVAIAGFCLGGAVSLAAAFQVEGLAAALPFYGNARADLVDFERAVPPIQGHYAANDSHVNVARTREIAAGVEQHGGVFELHVYEAGHAFMRSNDPAAYEPVAAKMAWERSLRFLRAHLASD